MVGIAEEYDSQIHLIIQEYLELQKKNSEHELLSLVSLHPDKRGFDMIPDFMGRCLPADFGGEHPCLFAMGYYYAAMRNAVWGSPYELPPTLKKHSEESEEFFYESLDELFP